MTLQLSGQDDQPSLQDEAPLTCTSVVCLQALSLPHHPTTLFSG